MGMISVPKGRITALESQVLALQREKIALTEQIEGAGGWRSLVDGLRAQVDALEKLAYIQGTDLNGVPDMFRPKEPITWRTMAQFCFLVVRLLTMKNFVVNPLTPPAVPGRLETAGGCCESSNLSSNKKEENGNVPSDP